MKTLRKLFYVACTTFFLTSCEETYNDKLFWPGELSQEYGSPIKKTPPPAASYIKPSTLDLTYSGEKLIGKTVSFQTEDSKKGTLTLNDIIPGEKETSFRINLSEQEDNYTFSGETVSGAGATVKYAGSITPKTMKLDLNVTMPQNQWMKTYQMSELTRGRGKDVIRNQTTGEYEWGESDNQILTAALYTDMDLEMVKEAGSLYATVSVIIKGMGGYLLPQLLKSVTLESDGNITAEYTSDELQLGEQKFSEIDMDNPASQQQVINFIMMKLMFNTLSADDITAATQGRNYAESPRGLAFWYLKNDLLYVKLNLPGIISLVMQGQGQTVDAHLIAGIADAILKSNPFLLKTLLGVVSESLDNSLLSMIANMDHQSFQMFFSWIKEGIPMQIEKENGHTHIYLNREALSPLIAFIPHLQPVMEGIPNFGPMLYNSYIGPLYDNWSIITQLDLGLDLTDKNE